MTGYQFPCSHAPVVSMQMDDVWYGMWAKLITSSHLVGGSLVGTPGAAPHS